MSSWKNRGGLYKIGYGSVILGSLVFIVGFCTPTWASYCSGDSTQFMGLWQTCVSDLSLCAMSVESDNPGWLKAVRALECISMFFAVAACVVGTYCNCVLKARMSTDFFNKNMETSAVVSVIFCTFGLIIFSTQASRFHSGMVGQLSWGFILTCVGDIFIGTGAFAMLISRKLQLMVLHDYFAHRQLQDSFHTDVQFPDYTRSEISRGQVNRGEDCVLVAPPAYETVVNCVPQDEVAPPPYSQVVTSGEEVLQATGVEKGAK